MPEYFDALETRDPEERERALMSALAAQVAHAKANTAYYAKLFAEIDPETVRSRQALAQLPLTRKSDLIALQAADPPFGGLAALPASGLKRLFVSPGPIYDPEGEAPDYFRFARALFACGIRRGMILHNTFAYHFTPAGFMFDGAARALGCPVIPAGPGNTELQARAIAHYRPAAYVGTPDFLKTILVKAEELGLDASSIRYGHVTAGPFLPA
ncbi:MAG: phenylacetate--CoA ligase family protein, partial [Elioraea sp.]|nr:phenylacetate--CoA ligase family protein [Elioraea sp.]